MADYDQTLKALLKAQKHEPAIVKLSEPLSGHLKQNEGERTSDASADVFENRSPANLEADLEHYKVRLRLSQAHFNADQYKELFSKLRFSFLEQVTKERFIRSIVGDPPLVVEHQENIELERELAGAKASLKAQKTEVAELVAELEKRGRELCQKYESIQGRTNRLQELPSRIEELQQSVETLKEEHGGTDPSLNMPLEKTLLLVEQREREKADLDRQLEHLQTLMPRKARELDRLNAELQPLEVKRLGSTASAREAKRRKEEVLGGVGDDLEERGRWWRGVETGLKTMLAVW